MYLVWDHCHDLLSPTRLARTAGIFSSPFATASADQPYGPWFAFVNLFIFHVDNSQHNLTFSQITTNQPRVASALVTHDCAAVPT